MKHPISVLAALLALFAATPACADSVAIVNVNILPMTSETVVPAQTVLVRDGRIATIRPVGELAVPAGALVVDGTDRYLLPGFTEMHAHVTDTDPDRIDWLFGLFLGNGVTTIRGMLGQPAHLELREAIAAGRIFGPRLITSGPSLNGSSVEGAADGARQVREQYAAGYDFVKIHSGLEADEFAAIADTANELGMPFAGHVPVAVGIAGALDKEMATIDHLDGYFAAALPKTFDATGGYGGFFGVMLARYVDGQRLDELAAATAAAGVANVPTETLFEQFVSATPAAELGRRPEMRFVPKDTLRQWLRRKEEATAASGFDPAVAAQAIDLRRRLIRSLHERGGTLLLGSDAPQIFNVPGFSLHRELALLVEAGLTPFEALVTATRSPAEFLDLNAGTVEVGRVADLVLLDENPLDDIANSALVHGVLVRGRWARRADMLERAALDD